MAVNMACTCIPVRMSGECVCGPVEVPAADHVKILDADVARPALEAGDQEPGWACEQYGTAGLGDVHTKQPRQYARLPGVPVQPRQQLSRQDVKPQCFASVSVM